MVIYADGILQMTLVKIYLALPLLKQVQGKLNILVPLPL